MNKQGFTLIELLVIIGLIGVISTTILTAINPSEQLARARDSSRKSKIVQIGNALNAYSLSHGTYPVANSSWMAGLVSNGELKNVVPAVNGNNTCTENNVNGFCYSRNGNTAYVYTYLESKTETVGIPGGQAGANGNVYFGFDSSDGKSCARGGSYSAACGGSTTGTTPIPTTPAATPIPTTLPTTPPLVSPTPTTGPVATPTNPPLATSTPTPIPINLVQNPGFENGNANWDSWAGSLSIQSNPHSGLYSRRSGPGDDGGGQAVTLLPNTQYLLKGWGKVGASGNTGYLAVSVWNNLNVETVYDIVFTETAYTYKSRLFTTPPSVASAYLWFWHEPGGTSYFYADDLELYKN